MKALHGAGVTLNILEWNSHFGNSHFTIEIDLGYALYELDDGWLYDKFLMPEDWGQYAVGIPVLRSKAFEQGPIIKEPGYRWQDMLNGL